MDIGSDRIFFPRAHGPSNVSKTRMLENQDPAGLGPDIQRSARSRRVFEGGAPAVNNWIIKCVHFCLALSNGLNGVIEVDLNGEEGSHPVPLGGSMLAMTVGMNCARVGHV